MLSQQKRHAKRRDQSFEQLSQSMNPPCRCADAQAGQWLERGLHDGRHDWCRRQYGQHPLIEQAVEPLDQCLGKLFAKAAAARLGYDVARTKGQRLNRRGTAFLAFARQDRDLHPGPRLKYSGQRGKAALSRQFNVQQNQVDRMIRQIAQRQFGAVGLVHHLIGRIEIQDALDHRAHDHRIIDDEGPYGPLSCPVAGHGRHADGHWETFCTKKKR